MIQKTRGIVLRTVKYGETSIVTSIYTEAFGLQNYLVNGVRSPVKKSGTSRALLFQPAAMLDLVAYHRELKNLQRLKDYSWDVVYTNIFSDVHKNAVALFMVELLSKCVKQPEGDPELYGYLSETLQLLDQAGPGVTGNLPVHFAFHLPRFFGFEISNNFSVRQPFLDLREGCFTGSIPSHPDYFGEAESAQISSLLSATSARDADKIRLNRQYRRNLLDGIEQFYLFHLPGFGQLRSLPVLREIIS